MSSFDLHQKTCAISHPVCCQMLKNSACAAATGLLGNLRANSLLRGKGGCACILNGKPALLCARVMGGDYLAMQKDWMNTAPQIAHTLSLLPTSHPLSHSRCLLLTVYYTRAWCRCFNHTDTEGQMEF